MTAARKPRTLPPLPRGEGSIRWDEQRRQIELQHVIGGRRYRERADTVADALAARDARRAGIAVEAKRVAALKGDGTMTFSQLGHQWLTYDTEGAPKTIADYEHSIRRMEPFLGERRVVDLTVAELEPMYEVLAADLSASTMRKTRQHLVRMLAFAERRGWVLDNVAKISQLPKRLRPAAEPKWLSRDEFAPMCDHLLGDPSPMNAALAFMLLTGWRSGEALALRWSAVDLEAGRATVRAALQQQKNRRYVVTDTLKTPQSLRTTELPDVLVAMLRRVRTAQIEARLAAGPRWAEHDLVFTTATGGMLHPANLRRAMRSACSTLGIEEISPHKLRHTNLSVLLDGGMSVTAAARHAGHKDGRMVTTTYGHALDDVVPTREILDRARATSTG